MNQPDKRLKHQKYKYLQQVRSKICELIAMLMRIPKPNASTFVMGTTISR